MKKLALALLLAVPMTISMAASAKTVTVEVCDGGESGTQCRIVTYTVRAPSKPVVEKCVLTVGEAGGVPCDRPAGVPKWLKDLNQWFLERGFSAPDLDKDADQTTRAGG